MPSRYYADAPNNECSQVQPRAIAYDPDTAHPGMWTRTPSGLAKVRRIDYRATGRPHVCDTACQTATRALCECVCGGRNHGRFMKPTRRPTITSSALPLFQEIRP